VGVVVVVCSAAAYQRSMYPLGRKRGPLRASGWMSKSRPMEAVVGKKSRQVSQSEADDDVRRPTSNVRRGTIRLFEQTGGGGERGAAKPSLRPEGWLGVRPKKKWWRRRTRTKERRPREMGDGRQTLCVCVEVVPRGGDAGSSPLTWGGGGRGEMGCEFCQVPPPHPAAPRGNGEEGVRVPVGAWARRRMGELGYQKRWRRAGAGEEESISPGSWARGLVRPVFCARK
jgi:hypothetical protein